MTIAFLVFSLLVSMFHGVVATNVFGVETTGKSKAWKLHQFWLNFLGSVVGFIALWFLFQAVLGCAINSCSIQFGWPDVGLFLLAFLGVTGYVPFTVIGLASGINELAAKTIGLIK